MGTSEENHVQCADIGEHVTGTCEGSGDVEPRATSAEESDGGNLLVRIWRGAGTGNLPAYSTTAFSRRPPGRTPLVLAGDHRWRRPRHAPPARCRGALEQPTTPHRAAWTCRSGGGRLKPQG